MPTGYTYAVQEGKIDTLEAFAKDCARAFLWQARDSDEKDLVKLVTNPTDVSYYEKKLVEAEEKRVKYETMSDAEWTDLYKEESALNLKWQTEWNDRKKAEKLRYEAMLRKVNEWNPPSEKHQELKKFMTEQLEKSIEFDCDRIDDINPFPSFDSWKKNEEASAAVAVERAIAEVKRAKSRDGDFLNWVNQLLESVKGL